MKGMRSSMPNEVKWTEEQKQAIYEKGSNVLILKK